MARTFAKADWDDAQRRWADGEFSDEWKPYRHQAAMQGIIFPPEGNKFDNWEDDDPSQRAILIRAIRETPETLRTAIDRSHSWHQVIAYVVNRRDEWRDLIDADDRDIAWRKAHQPDQREATLVLKDILGRIGDS